MLRKKVDEMLSNYKEHLARCEFLESSIAELEKAKEQLSARMVEDSVTITAVLSGMPHNSGISDPTGKLGIMFASGNVSEPVKRISEEIDEMRKELDQKSPTVIFVNAWLKCLTERERFIIENKTIGGAFWRDLIYMYSVRFNETYSREGLKRIRDAALEKIYRMAA